MDALVYKAAWRWERPNLGKWRSADLRCEDQTDGRVIRSVLSQQHKGATTQSVEHRRNRVRTKDIAGVGANAVWDGVRV